MADTIRQGINDGTHPRGEFLPTEDELAQQLRVNRATVNRALQLLTAEGLTRVLRGQGTMVTELPRLRREAPARFAQERREATGNRGAYDADARDAGRTSRSDTTIDLHATPPDDVADILGTTDTVARARRMFTDEIPTQLATSWLPGDIARDTQIVEPDTGPGGIMSRLAEMGYRQTEVTELVTVRPPTEEETELLRMSPDQRVFVIVRTGWAGDRPVEVCVHTMPTHLTELSYRMPIT